MPSRSQASTLAQDRDRSLRMQRLVDARAPCAPRPPPRAVSLDRLETTLRKKMRSWEGALTPQCPWDLRAQPQILIGSMDPYRP